ncbi:MAG: hypothetical protein HGA65_05130 [Oscillochloris sp.]|nr:hypothetical protein [Oscillochloris sp.]
MSDQKQRTKYVAENRNPLARSPLRPKTPGAAKSAGAAAGAADPDAPTQVNSAYRLPAWLRNRWLTWVLALLVVLGLISLVLIFWPTGEQLQATPTSQAKLSDAQPTAVGQEVLGGGTSSGAPAAANQIPAGDTPAIGATFADYYTAHGGLQILGRPISEVLTVNGRQIQWFERARVEHWPEYAGGTYEIQLGRLGAEYTTGRQFATQQFFVSRADLRFFVETGHSLGGAFLTFWEQHGGMAMFGMPISEEFDEVLPDGKAYRVQYFERARLELHPEVAGTPYEVQVGLLGTALSQNESRPTTIQPVPTAVPLP